jgi:hypothetical protein
MENFNQKISKLKKDIIDITFDLNTFKAKNHNAITRIFNDLNKIHKKPNYVSVNKTFNNDNRPNKHNISNNTKNNTCYKKKSMSSDKKARFPFQKNPKICLSENNSNNNVYKEKRSITSYLNNNKKDHIKNEKKNNYIFEDNILYENKNYNNININKKYEKSSNLNINDRKFRNFVKTNKTIEDKYFFEKENENIISNYKKKTYNRDINDINNQTFNNNKNKAKHSISHKRGLFKMKNGDLINMSKNNLSNKNLQDDDINIHFTENNESKNEFWNLFNTSSRINTFYHPYINANDISQNIKNDILYKKKGIKTENHSISNYLINPFKDNYLNSQKKTAYKIKNLKKSTLNRNNNIGLILKYLDVNNVEEAKMKILNLKKCQNFYKQVEK